MPGAATNLPGAFDTYVAAEYDPTIALGLNALQQLTISDCPSAITPLAQTFPDMLATSNLQLPSGTLELTRIWINAGVKISNLSTVISVASSADITHAWFALFDTAYKVVAATADVTSGATPAAGSLWTLAIANTVAAGGAATSFTTTRAGLYYFGAMAVVTTTQPTLAASLAVDANSRGKAVPYLAGASTTGATTPPSVTTVVAQTTPSTAGKGLLAYCS